MDLRSIINNDPPVATRPAQGLPPYEPASKASPTASAPRSYDWPSPNQALRTGRPPPPPPLQPPTPSAFHSASRSPHHYASPTSSMTGSQYPRPLHSPSYGTGYV
ncbi:MAG: hypothetical protein M1826_000043 [Phylliscum demangeonii]|nr:MAG: hypothetical protein M1826_000043 [Phylliscum demangeonii]